MSGRHIITSAYLTMTPAFWHLATASRTQSQRGSSIPVMPINVKLKVRLLYKIWTITMLAMHERLEWITNLVIGWWIHSIWRPSVKILIAKSNCSKSLVQIKDDGLWDIVTHHIIYLSGLDFLMLTPMCINVLANNMLSAFLHHYFTSTFEIQSPLPTAELYDNTHSFPLTGERDHLDDIGLIPSLLVDSLS